MSAGLPVSPLAEGGNPIIAGGGSAGGFSRRRILLTATPRRVKSRLTRRGGSMLNGYHGRAFPTNAKSRPPGVAGFVFPVTIYTHKEKANLSRAEKKAAAAFIGTACKAFNQRKTQ
jgi:hypothetical protein